MKKSELKDLAEKIFIQKMAVDVKLRDVSTFADSSINAAYTFLKEFEAKDWHDGIFEDEEKQRDCPAAMKQG